MSRHANLKHIIDDELDAEYGAEDWNEQ